MEDSQAHAFDRLARVSWVHEQRLVVVPQPGHVAGQENVLWYAVWVSSSMSSCN